MNESYTYIRFHPQSVEVYDFCTPLTFIKSSRTVERDDGGECVWDVGMCSINASVLKFVYMRWIIIMAEESPV